jgi:uncharacterized protein YmfQ (DUF2313 family)
VTTLQDLLRALAELLAAVELRSLDLLEEADLRTTVELLPEWAAFVRLAEDCTDGLPQTTPEQRYAAYRKLVLPGGQNRFHVVEVARGLGYDVELADLVEFRAFVAEYSSAEEPCYDDAWPFVLEVHSSVFTPRFARTGESVCGEPLTSFGNELLSCTLEHVKPAHTHFLYVFDKPYVGYSPWSLEVPEPVALPLVLPVPTRT